MNNKKFADTKAGKIIYWITTIWLALGMVSTGLVQLMKKDGQGGLDMLTHLGYPVYILIILGAWKILGTICGFMFFSFFQRFMIIAKTSASFRAFGGTIIKNEFTGFFIKFNHIRFSAGFFHLVK